MRYAERDLTADQPGGPGCAMREWPLELETVQSRGGNIDGRSLRKHVGSKRHTDIAKARSSSSSTLLNYFTKQGTSIYVYKKVYM